MMLAGLVALSNEVIPLTHGDVVVCISYLMRGCLVQARFFGHI